MEGGSMNKIEQITMDVLRIQRAMSPNVKHAEIITTEDALAILAEAEQHLNADRPIARLVHRLKFDIIEGNVRWRTNEQEDAPVTSSKLIPFIRK